METVRFLVDGTPVDLTKVWVHLQEPRGRVAPYELHIPVAEAPKILGEENGDTPLEQYAMELANELGTLAVGGYFDDARRLAGLGKRKSVEWVIASLDEIETVGQSVVLKGTATPWAPELY